jgi:hypothetical protein
MITKSNPTPETPTAKVCNTCGRLKPVEEFPFQTGTKTKYRYLNGRRKRSGKCRMCRNRRRYEQLKKACLRRKEEAEKNGNSNVK